MYYTLQANQHAFSTILLRKRIANGAWGTPEVASFSGQYKDLEPGFSPDGKSLYFSSARPAEGKSGDDYDIWFVKRQGTEWGTPTRLGPEVNTSENEYYPSVTLSGSIYFTAAYEKLTRNVPNTVSTQTSSPVEGQQPPSNPNFVHSASTKSGFKTATSKILTQRSRLVKIGEA
jgi:hypothetical protein